MTTIAAINKAIHQDGNKRVTLVKFSQIRDTLNAVLSSRRVGHDEHGEQGTFAVQANVMDDVRALYEALGTIETLVAAAQAAVCGAQPIGTDKGEARFHPSVACLREALAPFSGESQTTRRVVGRYTDCSGRERLIFSRSWHE